MAFTCNFTAPFIKTLHLPDAQTDNEKELLTRIAQGDESAFEEFFVRYSKLLHHFILKYNSDIQLADDIIQDIFTKIWLTRESLPEIHHLTNYLFTMAKNYVANLVRQKIREQKRHLEWHNASEDTKDKKELEFYFTIIDEAITRLPEQQRKTWILSRREGKKYAEIALELGVTRETVKTNLHYANAGISKYVLANIELALMLVLLKNL